MKTTKVNDFIWKLTGSDNVNSYLIKSDMNIIIDCGNSVDNESYKTELSKIIPLDKINIVLFTHLHYDHAGNFDIFPNAKFYTSKEEIEDLNNGSMYYADRELLEKLKPLDNSILDFKIISTPGHTRGSICFLLKDKGILFTGDTFFRDGLCGRTDLDNSVPSKIQTSLDKIKELNAEIILAGHDY